MYNSGWQINDFEEIYSLALNNDIEIFKFLLSKNIPIPETDDIWRSLIDLKDIEII